MTYAEPDRRQRLEGGAELIEIRVEGATELWGAYARVSSTEQTRGKTIDAQIAWVRDEVAYELGINIDLWIDDGVSAVGNERPSLVPLQARLNDRTYAGLVVINPDRITRS